MSNKTHICRFIEHLGKATSGERATALLGDLVMASTWLVFILHRGVTFYTAFYTAV